MAPKPVQIPIIGGVNRNSDPRRIRDEEVSEAINVVGGDARLPQSRGGTDLLQMLPRASESVPSGGFALQALQVWAPRSDSQSAYIAVLGSDFTPNPYITRIGNTGLVQASNTYFDFAFAAGAYGSSKLYSRPQAFEMNGRMYVHAGAVARDGAVISQQVTIDFSTATPTLGLATWAGIQSPQVFARVCGVYRNRGVYADFGYDTNTSSDFTDYVILSDFEEPLVIGDSALVTRAFQVGTKADGRIMAVQEVMQTATGNPSQSALLVLREFAAYIINGEPNFSTDTDQSVESIFGSMVISRFNINCGCVAAETIARTPYGLLWAGHDQVWFMAEGSVPQPVGKKIRPDLLDTSAELRSNWHAIYHEGYYRLAIPSSNQTHAGTAEWISWGALANQWWLDLTGGPPQSEDTARWWGPQKYADTGSYKGTLTMLVENRVGGHPVALATQFAQTANRAMLIDLQPSAGDPGTDIYDSNGAATPSELTLPIASSITTKRYELDDPATEKTFQVSEIVIGTPIQTLVTQVVVDAGVSTTNISKASTGGGNTEAVAFTTTDGARLTGKNIQFTLLNSVAPFELNQWVVWIEIIPRRPAIG